MSDNMSLWDKLGRTDPSHTKTFKRAGGFSGTAIKPMWSYKRMTEEFGPCGMGWGIGEPSFQIVPGYNSEIMVYCTVSIWWNHPTAQNGPHTVYGVGGDKIVSYIRADERYNRPERWENDDEAFKKAYTDAVTNALKMIGVGADVHMGMFDDNKYVNSMQAEFSQEEKKPKNEESRKAYKALQDELRQQKSVDDLKRWSKDAEIQSLMSKIPEDWKAELRAEWAKMKKEFEKAPKSAGDAVQGVLDAFPGSRVINETHTREQSPLEAGE